MGISKLGDGVVQQKTSESLEDGISIYKSECDGRQAALAVSGEGSGISLGIIASEITNINLVRSEDGVQLPCAATGNEMKLGVLQYYLTLCP